MKRRREIQGKPSCNRPIGQALFNVMQGSQDNVLRIGEESKHYTEARSLESSGIYLKIFFKISKDKNGSMC